MVGHGVQRSSPGITVFHTAFVSASSSSLLRHLLWPFSSDGERIAGLYLLGDHSRMEVLPREVLCSCGPAPEERLIAQRIPDSGAGPHCIWLENQPQIMAFEDPCHVDSVGDSTGDSYVHGFSDGNTKRFPARGLNVESGCRQNSSLFATEDRVVEKDIPWEFPPQSL